MKITFIGHASILIEADGTTILSDPWWRGPCFGAQWWIYPEPFLEGLAGRNIDYIYISHGHHDHFHPGTLKSLPRTAVVLVSSATALAGPVAELGFKVIEVAPGEERALSPTVRCRIMPTRGPDTLMAVQDSGETCINLNDALHSEPRRVQERFIRELRALYPRMDYVFCGYGMASHFPNCYAIPGKDRELTAVRRQSYFNRQWAHIVHGLAPRHGFPFAADVVFLEKDLQWANEPLHNAERPTEVFSRLYPDATTRVHDIAPGFSIEASKVLTPRRREKVTLSGVCKHYSSALKRANTYGSTDHPAVVEVQRLLEDNVGRCLPYLASFHADYRFLLRFRNCPEAIEVRKTGSRFNIRIVEGDSVRDDEYDVTYTTRLAYLNQSLRTEYGHEILFVGSGGIFHYSDAAKARANLHRDLAIMMRRHEAGPAPRPGKLRSTLGRLKRTVKSALGRGAEDLYDLGRWTEFGN